MEVVTFGIRLLDAVTCRVLPDVALLTGDAMCAVVEILTVHTAHGAVKDPLVLLLGQLVEFSLPAFHLQFEVAFRHAGVGTLEILAVLLELLELFFMQDTLHLTLLQPLFPGEHARFAGLYEWVSNV